MLVYMYVGAQGSISSSGFTFSEVILLPSHGAGELRFERGDTAARRRYLGVVCTVQHEYSSRYISYL